MGPSQVHAVLQMEAQAEAWHGRIVNLRAQLDAADLSAETRASLAADLAKYERELATLDAVIDKRRASMGDVF